MSVVQGGSGFPLLADAVIDYLSIGKNTGIQVPDEDLPLRGHNTVHLAWLLIN